jgi:tetratricopeptide (TPR) repeat protein
MKEYDKAIQLYKKANSVYKKNKEEFIVSTLNLYIGNTYYHKNEIDSALPYLIKSLEFKEKINDKANLSTIYKTLSKIYFMNNLLDSAVNTIKKSIEINKSSNYIKDLSKDYLSLAEYYLSLNQYDSTIYYIKESIKISPENRSVRLDSYIGLSEVYERKKDYKSSLDWLRKGYDLRDSINEEFNKNDLKVLDAEYELEAEKKDAKARAEISRSRVIFISIIALIFLIFLIIIYKKNRTRKKLNNKLEIQNSQLNILNSKIEIENKEKIKLKEELHNKEINEKDDILKKLSNDVLEKNSAIEQLKTDLKKECQANPEIQATITSLLQKNLGVDSDIKNFDEHLRINYKDFHLRLVEKYPDLTPTEIKVCTLIKMNYDSKEIAGLLERSYRTVETHRTNIRKKMELESSQSLENNIFTIKK